MQHQRLVADNEGEGIGRIEVGRREEGEGPRDAEAHQPMTDDDSLPPQDYVPEDAFCWGLCCLKGCIMGAIGMTYFFVVLPTGVLLVFHGVNKRRSLTLNLGIGVLCIPTFILITTVFLYNYCHIKRKDKRVVKGAKKRTLAFENPLSRLPGEDDVCQSMCWAWLGGFLSTFYFYWRVKIIYFIYVLLCLACTCMVFVWSVQLNRSCRFLARIYMQCNIWNAILANFDRSEVLC